MLARGASVSDCGKYLIVTPVQDCKDNLLYFAELPETITGKIELTPIVDKLEAEYEVCSDVCYYLCYSFLMMNISYFDRPTRVIF